VLRKVLWVGIGLVVLAVLAGIWTVWRRPLAALAWYERSSLSRAGLTQKFQDAPTGRLSVWEGGSGQDLLLLHGAGDQAGAWSGVVPDLVARYHVLAPDLPGHGASSPLAGPLTIGMMLSAVESVLNPRPPGSGTIIVGHSLGAWVAMLVAHSHQELTARLILIDGGALRGEREDLSLMPGSRNEARRLVAALRDPGSPPIPDFVLDDVMREARSGAIGRLAASAQDMNRYLLDGRLSEIHVPVDMLWGGSDQLMPAGYAKKMEAQLPAARLRVLPKCGHVPMRECPESFRRALDEVLRQPPPGIP